MRRMAWLGIVQFLISSGVALFLLFLAVSSYFEEVVLVLGMIVAVLMSLFAVLALWSATA